MSFTLTPAAPFDGEVVLSLAEAKLFLKVDGGDEDALIGAVRDSAIDWVERYTSKALARRDWTWTISGFTQRMRLPVGPVVAVTAIEYFDGTDTVPVQIDAWQVFGGMLMPAAGASWPALSSGSAGVSVTLTAGFGSVATEAPGLMAAVKMLMGHLYRNRGTVMAGAVPADVPFVTVELCRPFRAVGV